MQNFSIILPIVLFDRIFQETNVSPPPKTPFGKLDRVASVPTYTWLKRGKSCLSYLSWNLQHLEQARHSEGTQYMEALNGSVYIFCAFHS